MSKIPFWFRTRPTSHAVGSKAFVNVVFGGDAQAITPKDVAEDMTTLLVPEGDMSTSKGLTPRPPEPMGAPSLFFFPCAAHHVISTMFSNLMVTTEVADMVRLAQWSLLVPQGFQLRSPKCVWSNPRTYMPVEGVLEKFSRSGSASLELEGIIERLDSKTYPARSCLSLVMFQGVLTA